MTSFVIEMREIRGSNEVREDYAAERGWSPSLFLCTPLGMGPSELDGPERSSHINVPRMPRGLLETHGLEPTCPDSSPLFYVFVHGIMITISMATVSNSI